MEPNRVTLCLACCSTQFYRIHWKKSPSACKRKKEWESTWVTTTTTASQTWGSPTTCFCSQHPKNSFKKWCTNSRKVLKKWDSGSTQERRKFSATKADDIKIDCEVKAWDTQASSSDSKKEMQIDDIKIDILTRSESVRYSGQQITFQQQKTTEIKNRIRTAWATFHKYRQELTSKNYLLKHRLRLFDAQRKMLRLIIQAKRRYKKIVNHQVKNSEDLNDIDSSCTYDESADGKAIHLTMTKTVTCHSKLTMTKKLPLQRSKKRTGLNTLEGAPMKLWKRWTMRR